MNAETPVLPFGLSLTILAVSCASAPASLMTFEEYGRLRHPVPYRLELRVGASQLLYYGAAHIYDAEHPQIGDIQKRWAGFRPTFALNEGGTPPVFDTVSETVGRNGESALVRWLARRDGIPVESLEPSRADVVKALSSRFTVEQQKVFVILRQLSQQARRDQKFRILEIDAEANRLLTLLNPTPGLESLPNTFAELRASVSRLVPELADWDNVPSGWFDPAPTPPPTWLNSLARMESDYRDEFMMNKIASVISRGHRVFAVVGASHVVMQERALRERIAKLRVKDPS